MIGRVAYGLLFAVALPTYLVVLSSTVTLPFPAPHAPVAGWTTASAGLIVMLAGIAALWTRGGGLPMNAYPPPKLVTSGVFGLVPHPIYTGFTLAVAGASLATGSATGLYLATPVVVVGSAALVLGHERRRLLARFGTLPRPLLSPGRLAPLARLVGLDRAGRLVLAATQRLANSWRAHRVGPLRVINHAVFSGLAGGVGAAIVVFVTGDVALVATLMVVGAVGAAIAGQLLVGSSNRLSRPFGYFGGLVGIALVGVVALPLVPDAAAVLAAFALAAPVTQAIGRLRCLVQGCCHGEPTSGPLAIVVTNPHSRVCALSGLGGRPIHPTQPYSIVGNLLLAPALLALWLDAAPLSVVVGGYLVGAGATRFVEEAYRGEPLTPVVRGLHLYQWFAVAMVVVGLAAFLIPAPPAPPVAGATWPALAAGAVFFLGCSVALSVDAPSSTARFSRLSG